LNNNLDSRIIAQDLNVLNEINQKNKLQILNQSVYFRDNGRNPSILFIFFYFNYYLLHL